jgi:hypothetical protein
MVARLPWRNPGSASWLAMILPKGKERLFQTEQEKGQADDDIDRADQDIPQVGDPLPEDHQLKKAEQEDNGQDIPAGEEEIDTEIMEPVHALRPAQKMTSP